MKNILFYNLWHNGDVFSGRGYIKHIIDSLPSVKFGYYHKNNKKIVADLVRMQFTPELKKWEIEALNFRKIYETESTIYINTWVGTYFHQNIDRMQDYPEVIVNLPNEGHGNYLSLHKMYQFIVGYLNDKHNANIDFIDAPMHYVPQVNWKYYDVKRVDEFVNSTRQAKHLICNGIARSLQTSVGSMQEVISVLAKQHPNDVFICTEKFDSSFTNIVFTDDIVKLDNDINEIAYLSTYCDTIIGKNSGPFMFTHVAENIFNERVTFLAFSHSPTDCYPYHMKHLPCKYLHSTKASPIEVYNVISSALSLSKGEVVSL